MFSRLDLLNLVIFFILMKTEMPCASAKESNFSGNPSTDFKKHTMFQPIIHQRNGRTKREILTTKHESGLHLPEVEMVVSHEEETLVLELRREEDLVAETHALYYQPPGGDGLLVAEDEKVEWCHYRGRVRHRAGSWCAVSTCHGVRGVVFDGRNVWYIQPADEDSNITSDHYLCNGRDLTTTYRCGHEHVDYGTEFLHGVMTNHQHNETHAFRHKRDASDTSIPEPFNANGESQYVELLLVADNEAYKKLDSNLSKVHSYFIDMANTLNVIFSSLNVYIALVAVVVWNERNPIHLNGTGMLSKFADYSANTLVSQIPHDNAHLLTGVPFDIGIGGIAYQGAVCSKDVSVGVSFFHSEIMTMTVAHEMGHSLGFPHDWDIKDCACPSKNCIMNGGTAGWSECNKKTIETRRLSNNPDTCLFNKPKSLFKKFCGNGFVEPGEQCDCGVTVPGVETNAACRMCCDPNTCRLRGNATCGAGNCCDFNTCTLKTAGSKCRAAVKECDLPEYCTGHSEFCPDDVYKMDTTPCGQGHKEICFEKNCVSNSSVQKKIANRIPFKCPWNCSDHGVFNSYGQCHCEAGFGPPLCAEPGPGGSLASGPATDPAHSTRVMIGIYGFFLCLVLLIAVGVMFYWYHFNRLPCDGRNEFVLTCYCGDYKQLFTRTTYVQKPYNSNIKTNTKDKIIDQDNPVSNDVHSAAKYITLKERSYIQVNRIDDPIINQTVNGLTNLPIDVSSNSKEIKISSSNNRNVELLTNIKLDYGQNNLVSSSMKVNGIRNNSHTNTNIASVIKRSEPLTNLKKADIQILSSTNQNQRNIRESLTKLNTDRIVHKPTLHKEDNLSNYGVEIDKTEVKPKNILPVQIQEIKDLRKNLRKVNTNTDPKTKQVKENQAKSHIAEKPKIFKSVVHMPIEHNNISGLRKTLKQTESTLKYHLRN